MKKSKKIYLDYAATTPVDPRVVKAMLPYLREKFGNTMSLHSFGQEVKETLERSRKTVADLISFDEDERLKIAVFDSKPYISKIFEEQNNNRYVFNFFKPRLNLDTTSLASDFKVICAFVNDKIDAEVVEELNRRGVELIAT